MQKFFGKYHPRFFLIALVAFLGCVSLCFAIYFTIDAARIRSETRRYLKYQDGIHKAQDLESELMKESFLGVVLKRMPVNAPEVESLTKQHAQSQRVAETKLNQLLASIDSWNLNQQSDHNLEFERTLARFTRAWREQRRQWSSISADQVDDWFHRHTILISKLNLAMIQMRHTLRLENVYRPDRILIVETTNRLCLDMVAESVLRLSPTPDLNRIGTLRQLQSRHQLVLDDYLISSGVLNEDQSRTRLAYNEGLEKFKYWRTRWQNQQTLSQDPALLVQWSQELTDVLSHIHSFLGVFDDTWEARAEANLTRAEWQFWISQILIFLVIVSSLSVSFVVQQGFLKPLRYLRADLKALANGRLNKELVNPLDVPSFESMYSLLNKVREQLTYREHILEERTAFFEYCPEIVATLDQEGRFHDTNSAFSRILGFSKESLLGLQYLELVHPLDRGHFEHAARALIQEKKLLRTEIRCLKRDGQFVWLQLHAVALQKNRLVYVVASDISQIKKTEAELIGAKEAAERANRAKTEFLANMSHEIRTPINGILGAAQIIDDTELDDHQAEFMDILKQSANGLLSVVNDILDISKIEAGRLELDVEPFNLEVLGQGLVEHAAMDVARQEKRIEVLFEYQEDLPIWFSGDDKRLRQVLLNLLGNAVKFTTLGHIMLSVGGRVQADIMDLEIRVSDSGIGIPEGRQRTIFEKFTQADASTTRRFGGTGLGLAICLGIIERMEGLLEVESQPGEGSTFTIRLQLPIVPNRPWLSKAKPDRGVAMVISNQEISNRVHSDLLRRLGYIVLSLTDVAEWQQALHQAMIPSERINLVTIDLDWGIFQNSTSISGLLEHPYFAKAHWLYLGYGPLDILNAMSEHQHYLKKPLTFPKLEQLPFIQRFKVIKPRKAAPDPWRNADHEKRILVVEDNKVNSKIITRLLARLGIATELAENGEEALDLLGVDQHFDMVLMDCQMPLMDGYEATRRIRKLHGDISDIIIVAMTAHAMEGDRERCLDSGMDDYMTKPIDFNLLKEMLTQYLQPENQTLYLEGRVN